jgi:hypothetical protein
MEQAQRVNTQWMITSVTHKPAQGIMKIVRATDVKKICEKTIDNEGSNEGYPQTCSAVSTMRSSLRDISSSLMTLESIPPKPHWGLSAS